MRYGHKEIQNLLLLIGKNFGYDVKKNFTSRLPTDGVWFTKTPLGGIELLPVVAIEVIVSEGPKSIRGSISVLESVSPSVAVIFIHDEEIRRRLLLKGLSYDEVKKQIDAMHELVEEVTSKSKQRFVVWTEKMLSYWERIYKNAC